MSEEMPWVIGLTDEEVQELRNKKYKLSQYGKEKLRKLMNKNYLPDDDTIEEMIGEKLTDEKKKELERMRLANKTFEELTKDEKIQLALEELAAIVMGGQDGEEFYNSVKFIKNVLESLRTPEKPSQGITQHPRDAL